MNPVVHIGVLGCAGIAVRSVIPALIESGGLFKVMGIASRTREKAGHYAERFGVEAFAGYQAMIESPEIQAVYIPLPNALHAEWIAKALRRGLHVLVEKSLACAYEDATRLNELARRQGLALVENFQFRFHRQLAHIMELVKCGAIGELRCLCSSFGFPCLPDQNDIRYQKSLGGGALLDAGAYPIKIAQIFLGHDIEVQAASLNGSPDREVDIWGGAHVKQKNGGLFGELAFGFDNSYRCRIELWGSLGSISTNRIFTAGTDHEPVIELETKSGKKTITLPADHHFKNMLAHFHDVIWNRQDMEDEYRQNVHQARLIHEVKIKSDE